MTLTITSAKLTGNPGASGWAQVHEFSPEEPEKLKLRGHLRAVFATGQAGTNPPSDPVLAGRELLSRLHEEYFGKLEGTAFNSLRSAVEKVIEEFAPSWGDVEIAAVVQLGDVVYSAVGGGAQISIFRNNMLAKILQSQKGTVASASGYPKDGDILVLATRLFWQIFPDQNLKAALQTGEAGLAVESLAPTVHSREGSETLGAIILKFQSQAGIFPSQTETAPEEKPTGQSRLKAILGGLRNKLGGFVSRNLPERRIYVHRAETEEDVSQSKKTTVLVGAILVLLLIVSIGFGIRQRRLKDYRGRYEARLSVASHDLDEAVGLASLNSQRARELFASARDIVAGLEKEGVKDPNLASLADKIKQSQETILGEYNLEPILYLDLSILSSGLKGDELAASGDKFFVLDKDGKKIVGVVLASKKTEVVAGPGQVEDAKGVAVYEGRVFILTPSGIYEVGAQKTKVIDKQWDGDVLPYVYASNFYLVDKTAGTIWRYPGAGDSFGAKQKWLGPGVTADFSDSRAVTVDGSIWVLGPNARILKFTQGAPQNLSISGVVPQLISADTIYTNEELKYLYVLDRAGRRVVVLNKNGEYKAQYLADQIGEAGDLVVSEKEKKIILLVGSKLYSVEIKHL